MLRLFGVLVPIALVDGMSIVPIVAVPLLAMLGRERGVRAALGLRELQLRLKAVTEERDTLARDSAGSELANEARERFYQFEFFKKIVGIELKRSRRYDFPLALMLVRWDQADPAARDGLLPIRDFIVNIRCREFRALTTVRSRRQTLGDSSLACS